MNRFFLAAIAAAMLLFPQLADAQQQVAKPVGILSTLDPILNAPEVAAEVASARWLLLKAASAALSIDWTASLDDQVLARDAVWDRKSRHKLYNIAFGHGPMIYAIFTAPIKAGFRVGLTPQIRERYRELALVFAVELKDTMVAEFGEHGPKLGFCPPGRTDGCPNGRNETKTAFGKEYGALSDNAKDVAAWLLRLAGIYGTPVMDEFRKDVLDLLKG